MNNTTTIIPTTVTTDLERPETTDWKSPELYPRMGNLSAGHIYRAIIRAEDPAPVEYVTIALGPSSGVDLQLAVAKWNLRWESAQFRRRYYDEDDLPEPLRSIADLGDNNVTFLPRTRTRYYEYAPLFHLLPRVSVERHGLPLLRGGLWPFTMDSRDDERHLPVDFAQRLGRAWAGEVWRHLMPASAMRAFTKNDPVKLLAQNLDYWIPPVTAVIQDVLRSLPEGPNEVEDGPVRLVDGSQLDGARMGSPRVGSDVWSGETEAAEMVEWVVDEADANGRLREVLDAVRSNRVEDDFSEHWSFAREDFERKLYRKRSKVNVRFVELTDTIPVQGPEAEVVDRTVLSDLMALLDVRERQVIVLLQSGTTSLTEIGEILGYSNHSAISKRLSKIRKKAERMLDE